MRVALLTCGVLPDPDPDENPLLDELARRGHEARAVVWDRPDEDFSAFDALLIRATWDYAEKADRFSAWLDRPDVAPRVWNRPEAVQWNLHKGYLLELETRGVPIVPTELIRAGTAFDLRAIVEARGWDGIVVKPAVSAGSARTRRFACDEIDEAAAFVRSWHHGVDAMVQPYLQSVEGGAHGRAERSMVWIDGSLSHVVEKSRRFADDEESVRGLPPPTADQIAFATRAVEACGFDVLYARVDVMDGNDGAVLLGELELIEPSLFFGLGEGSVGRYVDAVERRVRQG